MGIVNKTQNAASTNNSNANGNRNYQREEAVAFLNIRVKAANGDWISIPATIPMLESKLTHVGMVNKAKSDKDFVFEIEGTIAFPSTEVPEF